MGKAFKGTMCSYDFSGGVDMDHSDHAAFVAATVAHEMGHNFGMEHDYNDVECICPAKTCIMSPATGYNVYCWLRVANALRCITVCQSLFYCRSALKVVVPTFTVTVDLSAISLYSEQFHTCFSLKHV